MVEPSAPLLASPEEAQMMTQATVFVAHPEACIACEECLDACLRGAITVLKAPQIDAILCNSCGACVTACPNGVFETVEA